MLSEDQCVVDSHTQGGTTVLQMCCEPQGININKLPKHRYSILNISPESIHKTIFSNDSSSFLLSHVAFQHCVLPTIHALMFNN